MRRGMSRTERHQRAVKRAWLAAHQDARRAGLSILEAQLLAEHAARKMGAAMTRLHRQRQRAEAVEQLQRAGARAPERTPPAECHPARRRRGARSRKAKRQLDPVVRSRRHAIAARDRARARGELPPIAHEQLPLFKEWARRMKRLTAIPRPPG